MTDLFLTLLNKSIAASFLVLVIFLLRLVFKKAPKALFPVLWAFVALRLVLPALPESAFSLIPSAETISPENVRYAAHPSVNTGMAFVNAAVNPVLGKAFEIPVGNSVSPLYLISSLMGILWLIGVIGMILYAVISCFVLKKRIKTAICYKENIYQSEAVASPFVLGVFRPRIYLPFSLAEKDFDAVIAHEKAHIARGDTLWKPIGYLLLCVYWFNPLMWLAYMLFCRDIEFACDERVIGRLEPESRAAYSEALLSVSAGKQTLAACPIAFGEGNVKARIKHVLSYKKPAFWVILAAIIACAAILVFFMTNPAGSGVNRPSNGHNPGDELIEGIIQDNTYVTSECLYMSPLSSTWPGENDGYLYLVGADTLTIERQNAVEGVSPETFSVRWKWEEFPWTREELKEQEPIWNIGATGLFKYSDLRYQRIDDNLCLLYADGELLVMRYSTQKFFLVWSIYRLESLSSERQ